MVTVRYFAAARAAVRVDEQRIALPPHPTVADVLEAIVQIHGPKLAEVLARCSYLLDERAVHHRRTPVTEGQVLDVLPPFAGG